MTSEQSQDSTADGAEERPGQTTGAQPEPTTDPAPPQGPGGVDSKPDWEDAGPDTVVPDPPRSAQVENDGVPEEIDRPEGTEEPDSAGASDDSPGGTEEPAD